MNRPSAFILSSILVLVTPLCVIFPAECIASASYSQPLAQSQNSVPVISGSYVLAPDDILDIDVQGLDEFKRTVTILPDGSFNYVGVGRVMAAGLSVSELQRTLADRLVRQVRHPLVTVMVRSTHPRQVSVLGSVQTEGLINFHPGMRVLDAIAGSGGLKQAPELSSATLVTGRGTQSTPINMTKLMVNRDMSLNLELAPGDILLVSPRNPEVSQVQVTGQVTKAGPYPVMPDGATVVSLLNASGGPLTTAALTRVQVQHNGSTRIINLHPLLFNIDDPVGLTRVSAGDIINVPLNNNKIAVVGEVKTPQIYIIPDGEQWSVFTALTSSGGPTQDGDKKRVGIVRKSPSGQVRITEVNTERLIKGESDAVDPVLQPGDIVVVPKRHQGLNGWNVIQTGLGTVFTLSAVARLP